MITICSMSARVKEVVVIGVFDDKEPFGPAASVGAAGPCKGFFHSASQGRSVSD